MADFEGIKPHKDDPIVVQLRLNSFNVRRVLLDQGSSADLIYGDAFDKLGLTDDDLTPYSGTLVGFAGEQVMVRGFIDLDTIFGEDECARVLKVRYLVLQVVASYNVIIGRNTLNRLCAVISTAHLAVKYPLSNGKVGKLKVDQKMARECYNNCLNLYGKKSALVGHRCYEIETPDENLDPRGEGRVNRPTPIEETKALKFGDRTLKIGTRLTDEQETRLTKLLGENLDLFAWSCKDMPGIDPNFICHRLALNPSVKPVSQLRRRLGGDKGKAVQQEVDKLLAAEFIREVKYPTWLANVVMVKKANGKWRMCVDYTDLNKACPKDSYPLPSIDGLVDGASGNELLSLMDAYSGYHQIRMHPADEDKTAFMTARVNYCYRTMPFGLKNAGATYQRLMDRVFAGQVGRNMEVYVDDMIVKSARGLDHHQDLEEAFGEIRKHNMRLNPEKCSFGIQGGKFLGFMITSRGIEINPDKCKAIQQMKSPSNVKEVQRLTGRIAALSRFLPKSGDRSFPFFKCLRKNAAFEWTAECEEAFGRLKELLSSPPILSKPIQGHPLHLYFAVSDSALSSVILQELDGEQRIVYFVSHTLQGAEIRYQKIEKAALAVLVTARRLRPYFQSFPVRVRTDLPLRQVLQKPDLSGRLVAWSVELSEYGLQYDKRGTVGAQSLADFVVELTPDLVEKVDTQWTLFVDGSSNSSGSGAGVTLEGPGKLVLEQSLKFEFKATNNQAEYEALIAGLKLALEVKIRSLLIRTDSQLVESQVKGTFQVKDPNLIKYLERVRYLMTLFQEVVVEHVPRAENQRADALAKLASTRKPGNNKSVIQETLACPSIEGELMACVNRGATWMGPIISILAGDPAEVEQCTKEQRREASHYTLIDGNLYRRGFSTPLLKCMPPEKYEAIMSEVHEGVCASHIGGRSLACKVLRAGFYWPTLRKDCMDFVKRCKQCQVFADLSKAPPKELVTMSAPWPFAMWGVDLVGPFPTARSQMKFILVAVDYFTKWIEAEPLAKITSAKIVSFYWKRIVCRFGIPRAIVSDNGTQFSSSQTREFCKEMGIQMRFASVEHPQTNGQVESANRVILRGLRRQLVEAKGAWLDELPVVLWSYNTTVQSTTRETPFRMTYGVDAMLPVEIDNFTWRTQPDFEGENQANMAMELDLLSETRDEAHIRETAMKQRVAAKYNSRVRVRDMQVGDLVLKWRSGAPGNKLTPNWEGPYRIVKVLGNGAYHLEELDGRRLPRSFNGLSLRYYYS